MGKTLYSFFNSIKLLLLHFLSKSIENGFHNYHSYWFLLDSPIRFLHEHFFGRLASKPYRTCCTPHSTPKTRAKTPTTVYSEREEGSLQKQLVLWSGERMPYRAHT